MAPREWALAFWNFLIRQAYKAGILNDSQLCEQLDRSRSFLNTLKRRGGDPSLADAFGMMASLPEPEWSLLSRFFPPPEDRVDQMRSLSPPPGPDASLMDRLCSWVHLEVHFSGFRATWEKIDCLPIAKEVGPGLALRSRLEWLDEIHSDQPEETRRSLEELVVQLLQHNAGKAALNPLDLGELGVALSLWGSLPHPSRPLHVAFEAAALGLEAAERSNDEWCLGLCHWKAGLLLSQIGHHQLALQFLHIAGFHFGVGGHTLCAARLLGAMAPVFSALGRLDLCEAHYQRQLRCLPPAATRLRFSALTNLATHCHAGGRVAEALSYLEAAELQGLQGTSHAFLVLKKTALLYECQENARAAKTFELAIEALAAQGLHRDIAFASLDLAQYHQTQGQRAELRGIANLVDCWLGHLRGNTNVRPVLEDLVALSHLGREIPASTFKEWRDKLQQRGAAPTISTFGPGGLEAATRRRQSSATAIPRRQPATAL